MKRLIWSLALIAGGVGPFGISTFAQEYVATRVVDGDTIVINTGEQVRLIGIDTTETSDSGREEECFAGQAEYYLRDILEGQRVTLEYTSQARRDQYDRILAYVVRVEGNLDVNLHLLQSGYARDYQQYAHDRQSQYQLTGIFSRSLQKGFWGPPCYGRSVISKITPSPAGRATRQPSTMPWLRRMPAVNTITTYYTGR